MHGMIFFLKEKMLSGDAEFIGSREENVRATLRQPVMSMVRLLFGSVRFNQNLESNRFVDFIGSIWIGY